MSLSYCNKMLLIRVSSLHKAGDCQERARAQVLKRTRLDKASKRTGDESVDATETTCGRSMRNLRD